MAFGVGSWTDAMCPAERLAVAVVVAATNGGVSSGDVVDSASLSVAVVPSSSVYVPRRAGCGNVDSTSAMFLVFGTVSTAEGVFSVGVSTAALMPSPMAVEVLLAEDATRPPAVASRSLLSWPKASGVCVLAGCLSAVTSSNVGGAGLSVLSCAAPSECDPADLIAVAGVKLKEASSCSACDALLYGVSGAEALAA